MNNKTYIFVGLAVALSCGPSLAQRGSNTPVLVTPEIARERASRLEMEFVTIPPGSFQMGCSSKDKQCRDDERPARQVRLTKPFEIGKYEVTQGQWRSEMTPERMAFVGDYLATPVVNVSWNDVQQFVSRLNARKDGYHYRLPSEAEWEYAARAGTTGPFPENWKATAWYGDIKGQVHPVGRKKPNAWGLYDMLGNVFEWVQDWYSDKYDVSGTHDDPTGPATGQRRAVRGGSWGSKAEYVRVSGRGNGPPDVHSNNWGFRCVRQRVEQAD